MTVALILKSKGSAIITVAPQDLLADVISILAAKRIGAVLVTDVAGGVAGVLSERDVVRALARHGAGALAMPAAAFMTAEVVSAGPRDTVEHVMETMTRGRFRHLPILEDGRLVGIVSIGDVVKRRIDDAEHEARALRDYVTQAG